MRPRGMGVAFSSVLQHAVMLAPDLGALLEPLPPLFATSADCLLGEVVLAHRVSAGLLAYAIDPDVLDGGFYLRYDSAVGVTLSGEPQLPALNLKRSNTPPRCSSGNIWSVRRPSPTCSQPRSTSPLLLGDRTFPSLQLQLSSLAISSKSPTPRL